jgi:hypothetical protein
MATRTVTLKITLQIEADDASIVDIELGPDDMGVMSESLIGGVPVAVSRMIEEYAAPAMAPFLMAFADRCAAELSLDLETPAGPRKYVNAYPPKRYGAKRAAAFDVKSGRVEIYCRPQNARGRKLAEVVTNNGEPFAVKVYLHSQDAVDEAIALTQIGLNERER